MGSGAMQRLPVRNARQLVILPTTHLGWLAAASFVLVLAWGVMRPVGATPGLTRNVGRSSRSPACTTDSGG